MPEEGDRSATLQTSSTTNRKNRTDGWKTGRRNTPGVLPAKCFFLKLTENKTKSSTVAVMNVGCLAAQKSLGSSKIYYIPSWRSNVSECIRFTKIYLAAQAQNRCEPQKSVVQLKIPRLGFVYVSKKFSRSFHVEKSEDAQDDLLSAGDMQTRPTASRV